MRGGVHDLLTIIKPLFLRKIHTTSSRPQFEELDEALKQRLAAAGTTLEGAMKSGKIFKLDYTFLEAFQHLVNGHQPWKEHTTDKGSYKIKALGEDVWVEHKYNVSWL